MNIHNSNNTNYQKVLLQEQERLIDSMSFLGHMQNEVTGDWTVAPAEEIDTMREFDSSSDRVEETLTNESILETLEERLKEISLALEKIEKNEYGICEKCGKNIEDDKLKVNPATKYCMDCEIK